MFTTPLGEQPPTVGVGVGSQELMDLLLDSATDNNSLSWQEDVAVAVEMGRPSMTGGNTPTRSYMADSNLTTTTSNELNTPDLEMARPSWPTDVAIPSTSSSNQPATTSPLTLNCSGNVFIPMGSVAAEELCYSADSPSTFEMVNPFAVTDSSDAMFDALLNANGFGIDTTDTALNTIDDTDINNLDVNALLDMFDNDVKEETPEEITELNLPVVKEAGEINNGKVIATTTATSFPLMMDQQHPEPITIQIKPEDMPLPDQTSGPCFSLPPYPHSVDEDSSSFMVMPTTIEENNTILGLMAEPIVVPKFNRPPRKRKYSEASFTLGGSDSNEVASDTQLAPTILMLVEGREKKTRGRPPVGRRIITPRVGTQGMALTTDDESATDGNLSDAEYVAQMKYRRSRDLNNEASKRCREKRKIKFVELCKERDEHAERNLELRGKLDAMAREIEQLKRFFTEHCLTQPVPTNNWVDAGLSPAEFAAKFFHK